MNVVCDSVVHEQLELTVYVYKGGTRGLPQVKQRQAQMSGDILTFRIKASLYQKNRTGTAPVL
jgi:hypothetical protein